jgi:hypothetical protein
MSIWDASTYSLSETELQVCEMMGADRPSVCALILHLIIARRSGCETGANRTEIAPVVATMSLDGQSHRGQPPEQPSPRLIGMMRGE